MINSHLLYQLSYSGKRIFAADGISPEVPEGSSSRSPVVGNRIEPRIPRRRRVIGSQCSPDTLGSGKIRGADRAVPRSLGPGVSRRRGMGRTADHQQCGSPEPEASRSHGESREKGCSNVVSPVPESAPHGERSYSRNRLCHGNFFGYRPKTRSEHNQLASHGSGSSSSVVKWSIAREQLQISHRSFLTSAFPGLHSQSLPFQMLQNRYYYFLQTGLPFCQWPCLN